MNLTDQQKQALNTLAVGTLVVRLADEHPEPFLVKVPPCPIQEGAISDAQIHAQWGTCPAAAATLSGNHSLVPARLSASSLPRVSARLCYGNSPTPAECVLVKPGGTTTDARKANP